MPAEVTGCAAAPRRRAAASALGALVAACWALAAPAGAAPAVVFATAGGPVEVACELATDPAARARGLMRRTDLPAGSGMLFVFPDSAPRTFWMKDTPLPLDLIFLAADGRVLGVVANATPFSLAGRSVAGPARYVLEVHGGVAAARGILAGVRAALRDVPPARI